MNRREIIIEKDFVKIWRDANGVAHVDAQDVTILYWGMGFCHAMDRGLQILIMRILAQGRCSEFLEASDELLINDTYMRRMHWGENTKAEVDKLEQGTEKLCQAYCNGINDYFVKKIPWELKRLNYQPEPWELGDLITLYRMNSYLTLEQSQAETEKFLIQLIQGGTTLEMVDELFPKLLNGLDEELIKKVKLDHKITLQENVWNTILPKSISSASWVIAGEKSSTGKPVLMNALHSEVSRLPNTCYELVLKCQNKYMMGTTVPGLPCVFMGRNNNLAWSMSSTSVDSVDFWIEHCQGGQYLEDRNKWADFRKRCEIIKCKDHADRMVLYYENDHGVLEGDPSKEGYYLTQSWTSKKIGARTLNSFVKMFHASNVADGMNFLSKVESLSNWTFADRYGNIGYQMSGVLPQRRVGVSGLVPLPGWKRENNWDGFIDSRKLSRCLNPQQGFFVFANNDLDHSGRLQFTSTTIESYRAQRIKQKLTEKSPFSVDEILTLQQDVFSNQAEQFLEVIKHLIPDTPTGDILRQWDCCYTADSLGASLFERVYRLLLHKVFAINGITKNRINAIANSSGTYKDLYMIFDRILLGDESAWFGGNKRDHLYRKIIAEALLEKPKPWQENKKTILSHPVFGGILPAFLGFDRGPITMTGGRATLDHGQVHQNEQKKIGFAPIFRMVADLNTGELHTNMAGGHSDRRFSRWYCSELNSWLHGKYKTLSGSL